MAQEEDAPPSLDLTSAEFVRAPPHGPWADAVPSMVGYRQRGLTQRLHRGLPSSSLVLVIGIDAPIVVGSSEDDPAPFSAHALVGPLATQPAYIDQPRDQEGLQLAVDPLAARWLFGAPASRLPGLALDLLDMIGPEAGLLQRRVEDEEDWDLRFAAVGRFLLDRLHSVSGAAATPPRAEVAEGWRWIVSHGGNGGVDALCAHVGLGPRQLRKVFTDEFGLGPKALSRLVRFERAVAMVRDRAAGAGTGTETLSDIAARAGYADHAHFDREFRGMVGTSPSAWIDEERRNLQAGGHRSGSH